MIKVYSQFKAVAVTILFAVFGIVACYKINPTENIPFVIFYFTLVINTFFSIKFFAEITPQNSKTQNIIDIILVISYFLLAVNLGNIIYFAFFAVILFIVATLKYVFLLGKLANVIMLKRKILTDILGLSACAVALGGIIAGYPNASAWILTVAFVIANVYFLAIKPTYKQ